MDQTRNDDVVIDPERSTGQPPVTRWLALALVAIAVAAYLPALRAGFIWDDDAYVTKNILLTAPDGLQRIWFSAHFQSQYFPLVYTTLRFEHAVWGLNPVGYHFVNMLLHAMNALLIWTVLKRLAVPGAWLAAAVWAVHPINVESVAWITELKNTQSTLFYLLALLSWMKFTDDKTARPQRFYILALCSQALALFSKTTACTLPAAMLLVLWLRRKPIGRRRLVQVVPFVVLGVAMGLLSLWWEGHLGNRGEKFGFTFNVLERLLIASRALWFYAGKLVWPTKLTFSYARWEINARDPSQYIWLIGCVAVASLLWWRRNTWGRPPIAAVVFFVAALSPMLGFAFTYTFRYTFVADHYQYLASIGLIAPAVGAGVMLAHRADRWGRNLGKVVAGAVLLTLGVITWGQTRIYQDPETLWRDTLKKNPGSWLAHNNLGAVLLDRGQRGHQPDLIEAAVDEFREVIRLKPDHVDAHFNLANTLLLQGKTPEAMRHYRLAIRYGPNDAEIRWSLAQALEQQGDMVGAAENYQQAVRIKPDFVAAHYNLANILARFGRNDEAIAQFQQAVQLQPDLLPAQFNLATMLLAAGNVEEAIGHYQQTLALKPDLALAHHGLGVAFAKLGQYDRATNHCDSALEIDPDLSAAQADLAWLLATHAGATPADVEHAVALAVRACQLTDQRQPAYLDALGAALAAAGQFPQAIETASRALELANKSGNAGHARQIQAHLELYRAGRAYQVSGTVPLPSEW